MSMTTELAQRMKAAAQDATMGEWWSDVVETDGEYGDGEDRESGYHSYAVYDAQGRSLLDMTNSTAATIQTEWDRDYHLAWDVVGEHNAKHIIASQPQNVLALVEALEAKDKQIAKDVQIKARLYRESNSLHDRLRDAEKRIAELERFKVAFTEWLDKTEWVQSDKRFDVVKPWGKHRAEVLKLYIEHLEARALTVKLPVVGWVRADYYSDRRMGNAPVFILGKENPASAWGIDYVPLTGNSLAIPDGWQLVPVEPTPEMGRAALFKNTNAAVWKAMLAAAPQQERK